MSHADMKCDLIRAGPYDGKLRSLTTMESESSETCALIVNNSFVHTEALSKMARKQSQVGIIPELLGGASMSNHSPPRIIICEVPDV